METYKNEEYLKKEIMDQSRHQFIYGYESTYRSQFLQSIESSYPVKIDSKDPISLYLNTFGIPKIDYNKKEKDPYLISSMGREYFYFAVVSKLLERTLKLDASLLDGRFKRIIQLTNIGKNNGYPDIETLEELLKEVQRSRDFYYRSYLNYAKGLIESVSIDDIAIPFMQLEIFISQYKEAMNIESYLGIILDKKGPLEIPSIQAVNNLLGSRINKDISVKVITEPDNWETYRDVNGQMIESIHDYGEVELDSSHKDYMLKLKR